MGRQSLAWVCAGLAALAAPVFEIGCVGRPTLPEVAEAVYAGPAISLDAGGPTYTAVLQAPAPGWVMTLDRTADQYKHRAVFLTLRRPNPGFLYPELAVEQRVATFVPTAEAVKVYVRLLAWDDQEGDVPYVKAVESGEATTQ